MLLSAWRILEHGMRLRFDSTSPRGICRSSSGQFTKSFCTIRSQHSDRGNPAC